MELRKFRESRLAMPVAVVAASLGFTACGEQTDVTIQDGKFTPRGYEQEVNSGNKYRIECDNGTLVKKLDSSARKDQFSYHYPDHPACEDGQLTKEDSDLYDHDPFVNEYSYENPSPEQNPDK